MRDAKMGTRSAGLCAVKTKTRAMVVMLSGFVSVPGAQIYYETYTPEHTQQKQPDVQTLMCTPVGRTHTHSHTPLAMA